MYVLASNLRAHGELLHLESELLVVRKHLACTYESEREGECVRGREGKREGGKRKGRKEGWRVREREEVREGGESV